MVLKKFDNNPNHEYIYNERGKSQSREIAEKYIYNKNKDKYLKPFNEYKVHHIDGDTFNNSIKNLYICTEEEHHLIHGEQKKRRMKFKTSNEIDFFLNNRMVEEDINQIERYIPQSFLNSKPIYVEYDTSNEEERERIARKLYEKIDKNEIEKNPQKISKEIFLNPIIFHLISLVVFWIVFLLLIYVLFFTDNYHNIFHFLSNELSGFTIGENILFYFGIYLLLGVWWIELIRRKI